MALILGDERLWEMKLLGINAEVVTCGFDRYRDSGHVGGDITVYAFDATVLINGNEQEKTFALSLTMVTICSESAKVRMCENEEDLNPVANKWLMKV